MEKKYEGAVDYIFHESEMARMERMIHRLYILCFVMFLALIFSNIGWLVYEGQFEDSVTVTQETPAGNNNYVGNNGSITNGETDNNKDQTP